MNSKILIKALTGCLLILLFTQCQSPADRAETLTDFVGDFISADISNIDLKAPIASIAKEAKLKAKKTITLTKANCAASLEEAKNYKFAMIIVGKHTIVKITDFDDTQKSTSWACSMPYGTGFIQNDGLEKHSDYINQIIGMPDKQSRLLFLFD